MWIQIVLSVLLAVVAVRVLVYAARHELVPVVGSGEDFVVRMPRIFLLVGIVLVILAVGFTLSLIVWQTTDVWAIAGTAAVGIVALWFILRGGVWKIEVKPKYMIFVSMVGVKRLVHYDDIGSAHLSSKGLTLTTLLKTYKISPRALYLENMLETLADNKVPVYRD